MTVLGEGATLQRERPSGRPVLSLQGNRPDARLAGSPRFAWWLRSVVPPSGALPAATCSPDSMCLAHCSSVSSLCWENSTPPLAQAPPHTARAAHQGLLHPSGYLPRPLQVSTVLENRSKTTSPPRPPECGGRVWDSGHFLRALPVPSVSCPFSVPRRLCLRHLIKCIENLEGLQSLRAGPLRQPDPED